MSQVVTPSEGNETGRNAAHDAFSPEADARRDRRRALLVLLGLTVMFVTSAVWRPADNPTFNLCPLFALTGVPCPGCGMTRAFCALAHGEFLRAVHFNALSPALFLAGVLAWTSAAATLINQKRLRAVLARLRPNAFASKLILAFVCVWWAARLIGGF